MTAAMRRIRLHSPLRRDSRLPTTPRSPSLPVLLLPFYPTEAIAAVDGPVACRHEWHRSVLAALGTDHRVHLTGASIVPAPGTTAIPLVPSLSSTGRATLRLICVALFGVIRLVVGAKGKRLSAVHAGQRSIFVAHLVTSFPKVVGKNLVTKSEVIEEGLMGLPITLTRVRLGHDMLPLLYSISQPEFPISNCLGRKHSVILDQNQGSFD